MNEEKIVVKRTKNYHDLVGIYYTLSVNMRVTENLMAEIREFVDHGKHKDRFVLVDEDGPKKPEPATYPAG